jgi:hypothetical protein
MVTESRMAVDSFRGLSLGLDLSCASAGRAVQMDATTTNAKRMNRLIRVISTPAKR